MSLDYKNWDKKQYLTAIAIIFLLGVFLIVPSYLQYFHDIPASQTAMAITLIYFVGWKTHQYVLPKLTEQSS